MERLRVSSAQAGRTGRGRGGQPDADLEDAIAWLQELTAALSIPGLASYKLSEEEIPAVVTAAQKASSMRGNPIELSDAEVTEIVTRSL